MSNPFDVKSGRNKVVTDFQLTAPLHKLMATDVIKDVIREVESDLKQSDFRRDHNGRDHVAVFMDLNKPAQLVIKSLYEQEGWVVEFEQGTIKFYIDV